MKKRFSEMTRDELETELKLLMEQMKHAQFPSEREILQSKYNTAKAYTLDAAGFLPGVYRVQGFDEPFHLKYVNGIMAWGEMGADREASFPLSLLEPHK
ncbi:DUF1811 family protein [Paenibacillus thalictri]|uniref:DUF1811 family protein n=1 Tax=Paenibacillus thalictri TaxID=2527873 RepID=A0A4Q9DS61_9BACL|nr:DUF1811 family protein [Paenibacillus thalictri]TBL78226.1 DUF1811 family protein [Paenibacillus thalictri]